MLCRFHTTSRFHYSSWHGLFRKRVMLDKLGVYFIWKDCRQSSRFNISSFLMILTILYILRTHHDLCRPHGYIYSALIQWGVWEHSDLLCIFVFCVCFRYICSDVPIICVYVCGGGSVCSIAFTDEMWKLARNHCFNDIYHNTRATFMLKYCVDYRC